MPLDNQVLEDIQREVKGFGDNFKGLQTSMMKDLEAVRKVAEEAKAAASQPEVKAQIDALTTLVTEKNEGLKKLIEVEQKRADEIETMLKRAPLGEKGADVELEKKEARDFFVAREANAGRLSAEGISDDRVDFEGYKLWAKAFGMYLRTQDDRRIDTKALSVGTNPDGGYLVPIQLSNRIIKKIFETSPIRQMASIETIGTSELEIAIDVDEATAGWVGETQTRAETGTPQIGVQKIPVWELYAKPRITQKMLEDSSINIEAWLADKVSNKLSRVEATAFISGNGVNKPRGILSYPAGTGRAKIPQFVSGAATGITADALVKMPYQLKAAYMTAGTWIMNRLTVGEVMVLKDGDGQYLWRPIVQMGNPVRPGVGDATAGVIYTAMLGGYPVALADDMPVLASNSLSIAFGDFRRGYTVVDRLGITTLRDPYSAKPFVEYYTRKRVGGDVVDFDAFLLMKTST